MLQHTLLGVLEDEGSQAVCEREKKGVAVLTLLIQLAAQHLAGIAQKPDIPEKDAAVKG